MLLKCTSYRVIVFPYTYHNRLVKEFFSDCQTTDLSKQHILQRNMCRKMYDPRVRQTNHPCNNILLLWSQGVFCDKLRDCREGSNASRRMRDSPTHECGHYELPFFYNKHYSACRNIERQRWLDIRPGKNCRCILSKRSAHLMKIGLILLCIQYFQSRTGWIKAYHRSGSIGLHPKMTLFFRISGRKRVQIWF